MPLNSPATHSYVSPLQPSKIQFCGCSVAHLTNFSVSADYLSKVNVEENVSKVNSVALKNCM